MSPTALPEGLPEPLPTSERMLWQGRPRAGALIRTAYRLPWVAGYFSVLFAWRLASAASDGAGAVGALVHAAWILPLAAAAVGVIALIGWASARTTRYVVTDRRVVLKIGIALPITVNLPFTVVDGAAVKRNADGTGDIAFSVERGQRAGYAVLWPHARPWRLARPEPSLRAVPDVDRLAARISEALGGSARAPVVAVAARPPVAGDLVAAE